MFIVNGVSGASLHCINLGVATDPSMGIGNFEGMLPDSLSGCKVYGIELDSISGRIAQQLYQLQFKAMKTQHCPTAFLTLLSEMFRSVISRC